MLFTTPTQFLVLMLILLAGFVFGLASAPGGKKWRERYRGEERARATAEADLKTAQARIRELEAERDRAIAASTAVPAAATGATGATAAAAAPRSTRRGWFGWGSDNLSRIRGIDDARERALRDAGIRSYEEIEALSADEAAALEDRLVIPRGTIAREGWREQARMLREGEDIA